MKRNKFITLGTIGILATPIVAVVSCTTPIPEFKKPEEYNKLSELVNDSSNFVDVHESQIIDFKFSKDKSKIYFLLRNGDIGVIEWDDAESEFTSSATLLPPSMKETINSNNGGIFDSWNKKTTFELKNKPHKDLVIKASELTHSMINLENYEAAIQKVLEDKKNSVTSDENVYLENSKLEILKDKWSAQEKTITYVPEVKEYLDLSEEDKKVHLSTYAPDLSNVTFATETDHVKVDGHLTPRVAIDIIVDHSKATVDNIYHNQVLILGEASKVIRSLYPEIKALMPTTVLDANLIFKDWKGTETKFAIQHEKLENVFKLTLKNKTEVFGSDSVGTIYLV